MHELEINLKFVCNDVNLRKEGFIMKRFIISVFLVLMMFAFIGCDITECNISVENNDDYGWDYLGYAYGEYTCSILATEYGYDYYMYDYDSGYCYGSY